MKKLKNTSKRTILLLTAYWLMMASMVCLVWAVIFLWIMLKGHPYAFIGYINDYHEGWIETVLLFLLGTGGPYLAYRIQKYALKESENNAD